MQDNIDHYILVYKIYGQISSPHGVYYTLF